MNAAEWHKISTLSSQLVSALDSLESLRKHYLAGNLSMIRMRFDSLKEILREASNLIIKIARYQMGIRDSDDYENIITDAADCHALAVLIKLITTKLKSYWQLDDAEASMNLKKLDIFVDNYLALYNDWIEELKQQENVVINPDRKKSIMATIFDKAVSMR